MTATMRVDLHCHSIHSDGALAPAEVVQLLVAGGVAVASLVDHDTLEGLEEFSQLLAQHEIGYIPGVEITTRSRDGEVHLLAYGIDTAHAELHAVLDSVRQARTPEVHSIAGSIRGKGLLTSTAVEGMATGDRIDIADAIALIHRAGGRAFLAHPLVTHPEIDRLEELVVELQAQGLDGIEVYYESFSDEQREQLAALADRLGLLTSAGTDLHDRKPWQQATAGIDMPLDRWKAFRDVVYAGPAPDAGNETSALARPRPRFRWRDYLFHFVVPTLLAIALFVTAIYAVFLPAFERSLLERKREMIRELTNSAWGVLAAFEQDERNGTLTREQAQAMAISRIKVLRYGSEGKDYFWLQDLRPRIIMHPYRADLNGKDVSEFRDPRGRRIFVEFADLVRQGNEGYVDYVWQWKDDSQRLVPKESYIKGFAPWGWIIGTGIYIEDVQQEISRLERSLVRTALAISAIVILLLLSVMRQSLRLERLRAGAEENLRQSAERYRTLVEATTEGMLLVVDNRCRYANPIFLALIGCSLQELTLLDLSDLFPELPENARIRESLQRLQHGDESVEGVDGLLRRRDGAFVECVMLPGRIAFAERAGIIILFRPIAPTLVATGDDRQYLPAIVEGLPTGVFRARFSTRGTLIEYNTAAARLFASAPDPSTHPITLADLFKNSAIYDEFLADLQREGRAERRLQLLTPTPDTRIVRVTARTIVDEQGAPQFIDGVVEDITQQEQRVADLETELEKMQTSLLFLHQPVGRFRRDAVICPLETPITSAAAAMTTGQDSALLVQAGSGEIVGIVTDRDLRERVLSTGIDHHSPVYLIMTSPLITISEHAEIYEALLLMEQKGLQHLAVTDEAGRTVGTISYQVLMQFQHYGPMVLTREIEQADTPEAVAACCRRAPGLARVLVDCGAQPHQITRLLTAVCDAATVRLIALAEGEMGPSPVRYAFIALGSQGRQEMTLSSDQDNAILYESPADPTAATEVEAYLQGVGAFVCKWLDRSGYPFCQGGVMAQNLRWCQPLNVWKDYFAEWIRLPEPKQLLEFAIFFDYRTVHGATELAQELRRHIIDVLRGHPPFYPHLAQQSLAFKPPLRLFGRILVGGVSGEHAGHLDVKEAVMPIVSFLRLYALHAELDKARTLDRLTALIETGVLSESSGREITAAYDFLMRLRLRNQAAELTNGQPVGNTISLRRLDPSDENQLNHAFAEIAAIQQRISYDFLGGTA